MLQGLFPRLTGELEQRGDDGDDVGGDDDCVCVCVSERAAGATDTPSHHTAAVSGNEPSNHLLFNTYSHMHCIYL